MENPILKWTNQIHQIQHDEIINQSISRQAFEANENNITCHVSNHKSDKIRRMIISTSISRDISSSYLTSSPCLLENIISNHLPGPIEDFIFSFRHDCVQDFILQISTNFNRQIMSVFLTDKKSSNLKEPIRSRY